ncbi:hypothetical protein JOD02_000799 [Caldicoprobacter guelmensis]|nr:hypothetical protein [Caldicoprobacter guelmensis]
MEFTNRCNIHTFICCLIHGFEYFGGVTDIVFADRMKTVILVDGNNRPINKKVLLEIRCDISEGRCRQPIDEQKCFQ